MAAVRALAEREPIRVHTVDAATSALFGDVAAQPLLTDDPAVVSWAIAPTRTKLWMQARDLGFRTVVDGEGGDEIFDVCVRATDFDLLREPLGLLAYLRGRSDWKRIVIDEVLAPRLRPLANIIAGRRRIDWFAPWMRASYRKDPATRRAQIERKKWLVLPTFAEAFPRALEIAAAVGSTVATRLAQDVSGVTGISPLLDRRIIELFAQLPTTEKLDPCVSKSFLRRVTTANDVATREKDLRLYTELQVRAFATEARREKLLERIGGSASLGDDVDLDRLREAFRTIASGAADPQLIELAAAVTQYAVWSADVSRQYGVT